MKIQRDDYFTNEQMVQEVEQLLGSFMNRGIPPQTFVSILGSSLICIYKHNDNDKKFFDLLDDLKKFYEEWCIDS